MNDRPSEHDRGPDVLALMLVELLQVEIRDLPLPLLMQWMQDCTDCILGMPDGALQVQAFAAWRRCCFRAWPGYPNGWQGVGHDLAALLEHGRRKRLQAFRLPRGSAR